MRRLSRASPKILDFFEGTENGVLAAVIFIYANFTSSALTKAADIGCPLWVISDRPIQRQSRPMSAVTPIPDKGGHGLIVR
jgi:hypothetical protein